MDNDSSEKFEYLTFICFKAGDLQLIFLCPIVWKFVKKMTRQSDKSVYNNKNIVNCKHKSLVFHWKRKYF